MTEVETDYASTEYDYDAVEDPFVVQPAVAGELMELDAGQEGDDDVPMEYF